MKSGITEPTELLQWLPKNKKISKKAVAGTTRDMTLTIPETLEIIRKLRSATSKSVIMAVHKIGLLTTYAIKKQEEKITYTNLGQYRCCLMKGTFNNPAHFQSHGYQIKVILLYKHLKSS